MKYNIWNYGLLARLFTPQRYAARTNILELYALIEKKNANEDTSADVRDGLEDRIERIFDRPKNVLERLQAEIIPLFESIIRMEKGTGAYRFYFFLANSKLSFSEKVLLYGIQNEQYGNNNDDALLGWIQAASRGKDYAPVVDAFLETKISTGHFFSYRFIFETTNGLYEKYTPGDISLEIRLETAHVIITDRFNQTTMKAVAIAILLRIPDAIPSIQTIFQMMGTDMNTHEDPINGYDHYGVVSKVNSLSLALFYLTGKQKYHDFYNDSSVEKLTLTDTDENKEHYRKVASLFERMSA